MFDQKNRKPKGPKGRGPLKGVKRSLRRKSLKVDKVDENLQKLMDDMLETMYAAPGIGLAAIQVGIPQRVIVLDISPKDQPKKPMFFEKAHSRAD